MNIKPGRPSLIATMLVALAAPVAGAQEVPPEADLLLWCGSAFRMMAAVAPETEDVETALAASEVLTEQGAMFLYEAGVDVEIGGTLIEDYDERLVDEFETGMFSYEASMCAELIAPASGQD